MVRLQLLCVEYPFITIISRSTLIQCDSTCWGPIYESNRCLKIIYNRTMCKKRKKTLRNDCMKNVNMNYNECDSLTSWYKMTLDGVTCH